MVHNNVRNIPAITINNTLANNRRPRHRHQPNPTTPTTITPTTTPSTQYHHTTNNNTKNAAINPTANKCNTNNNIIDTNHTNHNNITQQQYHTKTTRKLKHEASQAQILESCPEGTVVVVTKEIPVSAELVAALPDSVRLICEAGCVGEIKCSLFCFLPLLARVAGLV
jgi:hypothetical protein